MRPPPALDGSPASGARPPWNAVLKALRAARGVTLDGWGARLGVSRTTVQRWERAERVPDPGGEAAILAFAREQGLFRAYDRGPLAGLVLTPEFLRDVLAEARWRVSGPHVDAAPPSVSPARSQTDAALPNPAPPHLATPPHNLPARSRWTRSISTRRRGCSKWRGCSSISRTPSEIRAPTIRRRRACAARPSPCARLSAHRCRPPPARTWSGSRRPRAALGDEAFAATWAAGQALSLDQAVAEGLRRAAHKTEVSRPAGERR